VRGSDCLVVQTVVVLGVEERHVVADLLARSGEDLLHDITIYSNVLGTYYTIIRSLTQRSDVSGVLVSANKVEGNVIFLHKVQSLDQPVAKKQQKIKY
jgi:hypothetical protein